MSEEKLPPGCVTTLVIIFLAALIDGLDVSIVTVALPTMTDFFNVSISNGSWLIFAYVVGLAAFLLPLGKMAKNHRMRSFMLFGTAMFGISSMACGLTDSFVALIAFRLIQGISAAMMSCVLPCMIVHMLPVDRKGLGVSIMGASSGLALILGPVIGGFIVTNLTWHWLFFINIPICIVIVALSAKHIPRDETSDKQKDPTLVGGLSAMLLIGSILTILEDLGDPDLNTRGKIICALLIVISMPVLVWSMRRDKHRAIIAPQMILNREYLLVSASFLLCTIVVAGSEYLLPYVLQDYWGMTPLESSMYLSMMSVAMVVTVLPVGRMCDRYGCKWPSAMAIILRAGFCVGMILIAAFKGNHLLAIPALIIFGMSHAFSGTAQPTRMIHHSTPGYEDESTNLMLMVNYLASALGCVLFAMIYGLKAGKDGIVAVSDIMDGFISNMWFSVALLAIAMICTLSVKNKIVRKE